MTKSEKDARKNGLEALASVKRVLGDVGWDPKETDVEGQLQIDFSGNKIPIDAVQIDVKIDYERLVCYFDFRDKAKKETTDQIVEFSARANWGLIIGNFETDLESGRVRFKSSVDFTGVKLEERLIRNTIRSAMDVVEDYGDAAADVIRGKKTAAEAIEHVES
jgi:hypothetical protein